MQNKKYNGSVLVFSLIMLSLILMSGLAIGAATVIERKSSLTSNKSTQGFQIADNAIELAMYKLKYATLTNLTSLGTALSAPCAAGVLSGNINGDATKTFSLNFTDNTPATNPITTCAVVVSTIGKVKATGSFGNTVRAVEVPFRYYQDMVLKTPGLISYWKMDEASWSGSTAVQDAMNANDGTATAATTTNAAGNYKYGTHGGDFSGGSNYVQIPSSATSVSLDIDDSSPVTMEAWIKPASIGGAQRIFSKGKTSTEGYGMTLSGSVISIGGYGGGILAGSSTSISALQWHHVVGIIDGANSKIYVDGELDTATGTVNVKKSTLPAYIGAALNGASVTDFFNGYIDEVAVYDHALTAAEIRSHY